MAWRMASVESVWPSGRRAEFQDVELAIGKSRRLDARQYRGHLFGRVAGPREA